MNISEYKQYFQSKYPGPYGLIGEGISAKSASKVLELFGLKLNQDFFFFSDQSPEFNDPQDFLAKTKVTSLLVSPGYPLSKPWIQDFAKKPKHSICSEITLGAMGLSSEKVVAITGSLGKSTTVSLVGHGLKSQFPNTFVGGNLGTPLCEYIFSKYSSPNFENSKFVVLELSSYQLENCKFLKPLIAGITYLSANHLERYANIDDYYATKWKLTAITSSLIFLNSLGGDLKQYASRHSNSNLRFVDENSSILSKETLCHSALIGNHNKENIRLAAEILQALEIEHKNIQTILDFKGLNHRLQYLGKNPNKVHFINDSKATAIESVKSAVESTLGDPKFAKSKMFLLLGGKDKNLPWENLESRLKLNSKIVPVFFGYSGDLIKRKTGFPENPVFKTLEEAVKSLSSVIQPNDVVLLSPGGTSLDEFKNFEDRGQKFEIYCKKYFKLNEHETRVQF